MQKQSKQAQVVDLPTDWITRQQAAETIKRSVRTVDEYIAGGMLKTTKGRPDGARQTTTLVSRADAQKIAQEINGGTVVARVPRQARQPRSIATDGASQLPAHAASRGQLAAPAPPVQPWLTLDDASTRTGLPAACLRRLVASGRLAAIDVYEGTQASGASYRVHVDELDALRGGKLGQTATA